jgi:hypothetical protein
MDWAGTSRWQLPEVPISKTAVGHDELVRGRIDVDGMNCWCRCRDPRGERADELDLAESWRQRWLWSADRVTARRISGGLCAMSVIAPGRQAFARTTAALKTIDDERPLPGQAK